MTQQHSYSKISAKYLQNLNARQFYYYLNLQKGAGKMNDLRKNVFETMESLHIDYELIEHPAVYTIEEMDRLNIDHKNEIAKNLFIRDDKKKRYFLIVLQKEKHVNLKELKHLLNTRPLSFASEMDLTTYMNLSKGSVTPFGILNDTDCKIEVVIDKTLQAFNRIGIHPNDNTATVFLSPADLESVIKKHGNSICYMEL